MPVLKRLNMSPLLNFSFIAALSLPLPLFAGPNITYLMGYSIESVVRCNPLIVERYFNKHPEKKAELTEDLALLLRQDRSFEAAAHIDDDWIAAKVLKSIGNEKKPGISWVFGSPQNLDWRATFNRNRSLQEHWNQFLDRSRVIDKKSFDPSIEIFKARFTQDWVIVHSYVDSIEKVELVYIQPKTSESRLPTADSHGSKFDEVGRDPVLDQVREYRKFKSTALKSSTFTNRRKQTRRPIGKRQFVSLKSEDSPKKRQGYLSIHSDIAIHKALGMTFELIKGAIGAIEGYQALRKNPHFPYADELAIEALESMLAFKSIGQFKKDASSREELSKPEVKKFLPSEETSPVSEFDIIRAKAYGAMESLESNIQDTILAQRASEGSSNSPQGTRHQHMKILSDKGILTTSTRMLLMMAVKQIEVKFLEMESVATKMFGTEQAQAMIQQAPDLLKLYEDVVALREQNDTWQKSSEQLLGDKALASALSDGTFHRKPAPRVRLPIPDMVPESKLQ